MSVLDRRSFVVGSMAMIPLAALGCSSEQDRLLARLTEAADDIVQRTEYTGRAMIMGRSGYCADCIHYRVRGDGEIWHQQYCGRVENTKVRNHITGQMEYPYGDKYPNARKVNGRGQCTNFESTS